MRLDVSVFFDSVNANGRIRSGGAVVFAGTAAYAAFGVYHRKGASGVVSLAVLYGYHRNGSGGAAARAQSTGNSLCVYHAEVFVPYGHAYLD